MKDISNTFQAAPKVDVTTLSNMASLAVLSIGIFNNSKKDKKAGQDIALANGAHENVTRGYKDLLGKCKELDAIQKVITAARTEHDGMTSPWIKGVNIVPTVASANWVNKMSEWSKKYWYAVEDFLYVYNDVVVDAQVQLGSLFDATQYKSTDEVRKKFHFTAQLMPLGTAQDWRQDIPNAAAEEREEELENFYRTRWNESMANMWGRVHLAVSNMADRLDYEDTGETEEYTTPPTKTNPNGIVRTRKVGVKTFKGTLVPNVREMIDLLRVMNLSDDIHMSAVADQLDEALVNDVTSEQLKQDDVLRRDVQVAAADVLKTVNDKIASLGVGSDW
jgi:hypothetical protein|tara:strand:+ start:395 stop:1396 length:1002 start_codon:yes stop_codon:yes gene_type:complete